MRIRKAAVCGGVLILMGFQGGYAEVTQIFKKPSNSVYLKLLKCQDELPIDAEWFDGSRGPRVTWNQAGNLITIKTLAERNDSGEKQRKDLWNTIYFQDGKPFKQSTYDVNDKLYWSSVGKDQSSVVPEYLEDLKRCCKDTSCAAKFSPRSQGFRFHPTKEQTSGEGGMTQ